MGKRVEDAGFELVAFRLRNCPLQAPRCKFSHAGLGRGTVTEQGWWCSSPESRKIGPRCIPLGVLTVEGWLSKSRCVKDTAERGFGRHSPRAALPLLSNPPRWARSLRRGSHARLRASPSGRRASRFRRGLCDGRVWDSF